MTDKPNPVTLTGKRIMKELNELKTHQIFKILKMDDLSLMIIVFKGPPNTPYEDGHFQVELTFINYPFKVPKMKFITKIYHPNVTETGEICEEPFRDWSAQNKIVDALSILYQIVTKPDTSSPLREDVAKLYIDNPKSFEKEALNHTKTFAIPTQETKKCFI